mmetsp:Transcript_28832/g.67628  ORF Transcript_28832/g.67628 Transcript_28832/m.67628 type:complete len:471 (+) Transcript_28832:467-1879(+)
MRGGRAVGRRDGVQPRAGRRRTASGQVLKESVHLGAGVDGLLEAAQAPALPQGAVRDAVPDEESEHRRAFRGGHGMGDGRRRPRAAEPGRLVHRRRHHPARDHRRRLRRRRAGPLPQPHLRLPPVQHAHHGLGNHRRHERSAHALHRGRRRSHPPPQDGRHPDGHTGLRHHRLPDRHLHRHVVRLPYRRDVRRLRPHHALHVRHGLPPRPHRRRARADPLHQPLQHRHVLRPDRLRPLPHRDGVRPRPRLRRYRQGGVCRSLLLRRRPLLVRLDLPLPEAARPLRGHTRGQPLQLRLQADRSHHQEDFHPVPLPPVVHAGPPLQSRGWGRRRPVRRRYLPRRHPSHGRHRSGYHQPHPARVYHPWLSLLQLSNEEDKPAQGLPIRPHVPNHCDRNDRRLPRPAGAEEVDIPRRRLLGYRVRLDLPRPADAAGHPHPPGTGDGDHGHIYLRDAGGRVAPCPHFQHNEREGR